MFEDRKYVILTVEESEGMDFSTVLDTGRGALRLSVAEDKCVVKYTGNKPRWLYGKATRTHSEITTELNKEEWAGEPSEE